MVRYRIKVRGQHVYSQLEYGCAQLYRVYSIVLITVIIVII